MNSHEQEKQKQQNNKTKAYLSFKTQKGEDITYTSLFNSFNPNHEYESHNRKVRDKINRPTDKYHRLGNLKPGEWASVENQYTETGMFDFTVRNSGKIQSPEDIAFIFRSLESQSVEHAFAVYTNEKKQPFVQWLSMGGVAGTVIDPKLLADAAARFDAKDIYFVHNHPSGNLKASRADRNMLGRLKKAFSPQNINIHGIILNLNSGHYLTFQEKQDVEYRHNPNFNPKEEQSPVPIYSFSKRAFLNSPLDTRITSSQKVATFLSQQRFASGQKRGYLLLNTSNAIIGNFFPTEKDLSPSVREAATLASRYGATNIIAYGKDIMQDRKWFLDFQQHLKNFDINLLDVIEVKDSRYVKETHDYYTSLTDEGLLLEPNAMEDYSNSRKFQREPMDIPNEKPLERYKIDSNLGGVFRKNSHTMGQKNLDYLTNQIKYLGFGEKQKENLQKQMETGEQKFNLVVKQQYDGFPVNYTLHFDKSKQSDMYFLNSYKAMMENGREQSIYLNNGKGFTAKETFNMMQGRAVFKQLKNKQDGTKYHAWIKLSKAQKGKDVKDSRNLHIYNENYGYNLNESLLQHPIKELDNPIEKQKLIHSLHKGNRQAVIFKKAGREEHKFIEANPQFKTLQVYDSDGKRAFVNPKKNASVDPDNKNHSAHNKKTNNDPKRQTASGIKR